MEDRYKDRASSWDKEVEKVTRSQLFLKEITSKLLLVSTQNWVEIGCGTGLVGLELAPKVGTITLLDNSPAMIEELKKKIEKVELSNTRAILGEIKNLPLLSYQGMVAFLVFHHIENTDKLLTEVSSHLDKDGYLVIGDLMSEDGSFHNDTSIPHNGFNPKALSDMIESKGFNIENIVCNYYSIPKNGRLFPMFYIIARRK